MTPRGRSNPIALGGERYLPQCLTVAPEFCYVAASLPDGALVGPAGMFGVAAPSRPAHTGDRIALYLTGVGPAMQPSTEGRFEKPIPVEGDISFLLSPNGVVSQGTIVKGDYFIQTGPGVYQAGITFPAMPPGISRYHSSYATRLCSTGCRPRAFVTFRHLTSVAGVRGRWRCVLNL